jgi:hypothetical protein
MNWQVLDCASPLALFKPQRTQKNLINRRDRKDRKEM